MPADRRGRPRARPGRLRGRASPRCSPTIRTRASSRAASASCWASPRARPRRARASGPCGVCSRRSPRERPVLLVLEDVHWAEPTLLDLVEHLVAQSRRRPDPRPLPRAARPARGAARVARAAAARAALGGRLRRASWPALPGGAEVRTSCAAGSSRSRRATRSSPSSCSPTCSRAASRRSTRSRARSRRCSRAGSTGWPRTSAASSSAPRRRARVLRSTRSKDALRARRRRRRRRADREGLVRPAREPSRRLRFHHVLIRDVAYAGITKERRSKLHERVAAWLDAARRRPRTSIVGYHLEQAYRCRTELGPDRRLARRSAAISRRAARGAPGSMPGSVLTHRRRSTSSTRAQRCCPNGELRAELLCELARSQHRSTGDGPRRTPALDDALAVAASGQSRRDRAPGPRRARARRYAPPQRTQRDSAEAVVEAAVGRDPGPRGVRRRPRRSVARGSSSPTRTASGSTTRRWGEPQRPRFHYYRRAGLSPSLCLRGAGGGALLRPDNRRGRDRALLRAHRRGRRRPTGGRKRPTCFLAGLLAMRDAISTTRDALLEQARTTFDEHGARFSLAEAYGTLRAEIERLAGDLAAAEATLRRELRASSRRWASMPTLANRAARARRRALRRRDARRSGVRSRELRATVQHGRTIDQRGRLASAPKRDCSLGVADADEAEALARESLGVARLDTDALNERAKALLDLADVLRVSRSVGGRDRPAHDRRRPYALPSEREHLAALRSAAAELDDTQKARSRRPSVGALVLRR